MDWYEVSDHILKLRETAVQDSLVHPLPLLDERIDYNRDDRYGWDDRQLMWFYEAWEKEYKQPTTLLRRYAAEAEMIRNLPVIIYSDDLICGRADMRPLDQIERKQFNYLRERNTKNSPQVLGRTGHMALNYEILLKHGIEGLLTRIDFYESKAIEDTTLERTQKQEFYKSVRMQLEALIELEDRYVAEARARGLSELAELMDRVPRKPARTFHEALQSMHFFSFVLRDLFSCGHPDQYLIEYYRRDMSSGILTEEQALELIDSWNIQYTFYTRKMASISYMIGGRDSRGNLVENELTWLFMQSIEHIKLPYPSVGLAVSENTSDELLNYAIELLSKGLTHPAIFNQDAIEKSLVDRGLAPEHARLFVHSTCVEITPSYCSGFWATSPYHNCPQMLMEMLSEKRDFCSFKELEEAFWVFFFNEVRLGQENQNLLQIERLRNGGESPLASCLVADCLARGKNIDQGGALYNHILPDFIGVSNLIDSLAAIDMLVFREKKLTLKEYLRVLKNNYDGNESLRQYIINRCPHYGNNEAYTDELAVRIYRMIAMSCEGFSTIRGGKVYPGAFSFLMHVEMGITTMATPDGRKSGEAFNAGTDPVSGRDVTGPTASLLSTTEWPHENFPGGIAVNLRLNMRPLDERKRANMLQIIRTFLKRGGFELQINNVSVQELEAALVNPDKYQNLVVRIGGYSDFFVRQTPEMQHEIIARTYHEL